MPVSSDLSARLDAGSLVSTLLGALDGHAGGLSAVSAPDDGGRSAEIGAGAQVDPAGILEAVQALAAQVAPQLGGISAAVPQLEAIGDTLALIEGLGEGDLLAEVEALAARLGAELEGSRAGGLAGVLMRVSALLSDAPLAANLGSLVQSLLALGRVQVPGGVSRLKELLPAFDQAARAAGGLMAIETVLAESQRLMILMAAQIDPAAVRADLEGMTGSLGDGLAGRIDAVDAADAAALEALAAQLAAGAQRFEAMRERVAAGIGMGEATLAYLDIGRVQRELDTAAAMLRSIDLAPLGRLVADALGGLQPVMNLDIEHAPAQSIDALIARLEGEIGVHAGRIGDWDAAALAAPLAGGIEALIRPLTTVSETIAQLMLAVRGAMEQVREVVAAVPLRTVAEAIETVLAPVVDALRLITELVGDIGAALQAAATQAVQALEAVEGTVDGFKQDVDALFGQAAGFVSGLNLDQVAGQIGERVAEFAAALERAQMKPYFDTAVSAIGAAADVVEAVPFGLLPEDMKAEVDAAVAPIRDTDVAAVEAEIEAALGITPDGKFALRGDLEAAIAEVQAKYDALIAVLRQHDPAQYLAQLDEKLQELAGRIREIAPAITLQPVQDAIDQVKGAIGGFDLEAALAPLQQVFDEALAKLDEFSPAALVAPIQERLAEARGRVTGALKIEAWSDALDELAGRATGLIDTLDPAQIQPRIEALMNEARGLVDALPQTPLTWPGAMIAGLVNGLLQRVDPASWIEVQRWIAEGGGAAALAARGERIAQAVGRARAAVGALDLNALAAPALAQLGAVRAALQGLIGRLDPGSDQRVRFEILLERYDFAPLITALAANRERFLGRLDEAAAAVETLRRTGASEADVAVRQLNEAFAPLLGLLDRVRLLLRKLGLSDVDGGLVAIVRSVFAVLPPARLAGLAGPLFVALRGRVQALIDAVIAPLREAIATLQSVIDALDLTPLVDALQAVYDEIRADIQALSPAVLLAEPIAAFGELKSELAGFDPLAPLLDALDALRDTAARVLEKLSAQQMLASPLAIYREILAAFDALDIGALLAPIFDLIDSIARQVDEGLDETVGAFQGLQAALPSGGGGSSASVAVG
ncbi:MAG TPA: hypothetical protein VN279_04255 [Rhodocyclaceae bacterium]|jgi:hypothetical protein|nr:hypothetical protein [Rhodocyclaceae bacterium]